MLTAAKGAGAGLVKPRKDEAEMAGYAPYSGVETEDFTA